MAVASNLTPLEGVFGPITSLTLIDLQVELQKLHGTLADDNAMNYDRCVEISDGFIDELGQCINLSRVQYPDDLPLYDHVFDGLQEVINLMHGDKEGLVGSDGHPRLMDHQESRITAAEHLASVMEELGLEILRREMVHKEEEDEERKKRHRRGAPQS